MDRVLDGVGVGMSERRVTVDDGRPPLPFGCAQAGQASSSTIGEAGYAKTRFLQNEANFSGGLDV